MEGTLNPTRLFLYGLDWSGRTSRRQLWLILSVSLLPLFVAWGLASLGMMSLLLRGVCILIYAVLSVPLLGHLIRRINDLGWSGWAIWPIFMPYVCVPYLGVLLLRRRGYRRPIYTTAWRSIGQVIAIIVAFLIASRVLWTPYFITSGDMKPTFLVGDYLVASVFAPTPQQGDLVVLTHPRTGLPILRRVIGLPGDSVQMRGGILTINGANASVTSDDYFDELMEPQGPFGLLPRCSNGAVGQRAICRKLQRIEALPGGARYGILDIGSTALDQTDEMTVPEGHVFVLGDNRDNAADSRVAVGAGGLGMVPVQNIIGRAWFVLYSVSSTHPWALWDMRLDRLFEGIE